MILLIAASCGFAEEQAFEEFFTTHCLDCHDSDVQKGDVSLEDLTEVSHENAGLWKRVWEQVALGDMPPPKKLQPSAEERQALSAWITDQLSQSLQERGGFQAHHHPAKGNHLPHELLFGDLPDDLEPASTPARLWRIHPREHLVRLSTLVYEHEAFDPKRIGMRMTGDFVARDNKGDLKAYLGLDRVIGSVAGGIRNSPDYLKSFSPVLTTINGHGLKNYAHLYSVNGAEAVQILRLGEDVLNFMANGPRAKPHQFTTDMKLVDPKHLDESFKATPEAVFFDAESKRPLTPVYDLLQADKPSDDEIKTAIHFLFEALTLRPPAEEEAQEYLRLVQDSMKELGKKGIVPGLSAIFLDRDALFRPELVEYKGVEADAHGRVLLQGQELMLAINGALSYLGPDDALKNAESSGKLKTRTDIEREVRRILNDPSIPKPRILQFFREYFEYDQGGLICKDVPALKAAGGGYQPLHVYYGTQFSFVWHTDRLVELIVAEDRNVLRELLTTDRVVFHPQPQGRVFMQFEDWQKMHEAKQAKEIKKLPLPTKAEDLGMETGERIYIRLPKRSILAGRGERWLTRLPKDQRRGILTHPSWLVSHSDAMDNHAILRGKWIRERLLGGGVPEIPITVDAMLPDEPEETLRHRMRITKETECWRCHQKMDPLGLPFEMYNHIGLYRTTEQGKPVDTSGEVIRSGVPELDGPVENALDLVERLAHSDHVEQVFVRHAFRFWMGRNETINDAPALQAAWRAYHENEGSMKELLVSLLTSDPFLYRRVGANDE